MFKKKLSDIFQDPYNRPTSPLTCNRTPKNTTNLQRNNLLNLSPMKTRNNNHNNYQRSPRNYINNEQTMKYSVNKTTSPNLFNNNFQTQLSYLATTLRTDYDPKDQNRSRSSNKKIRTNQRGNERVIAEPGTYAKDNCLSNLNNNYQTSDRNMKQSKRLFANMISKMNEKNQVSNISQKNSYIDAEDVKNMSRQQSITNNKNLSSFSKHNHEGQEVSFKALKQIKMIQSVQPLPAGPSLHKTQSQKHEKGSSTTFASIKKLNEIQKNPYLPSEFKETPTDQITQVKKDQVIQLINNSFSSFLPLDSDIAPKVCAKNQNLLFQKEEKEVFESIEINESYDMFSALLSKINTKCQQKSQKVGQEDQNYVKASFESSKNSISMNPFL